METRQSIVVSNLPDFDKKKLRDKLEIHFGRRGNGGGDVDEIVIKGQCGLIGTSALITFAEKETVASVLGKQHIFFGKRLGVEPHSYTEEEQCNTDHNTFKRFRLARLPQSPSQDLKLIVHGRYADDVLQSTAALTNATLQVDEKSTKSCLKGPPVAIEQAVNILGKYNIETKNQPHGLGNVGQQNIANRTTTIERHEHHTKELTADKKTLEKVSVPKLSRKRNEQLANNKKLSRNIAKFDPKILGYLQAVHHRVITEAGERFQVDFEAKADGEVEFKSRRENTDQQKINESMKFLENLVDSIQKAGFVTKIVNLKQFKEAPKQNVKEKVEQTLKSSDVLVSRRASNTLEFYGTEQSVHYEIEKLREAILGRDLQTDSQGDIEQTVYSQTNGDGTQRPPEELGNTAMVGNFEAKNYSEHPERLASQDIADETSSAQGVQFKRSVNAPPRKPSVHPLVQPEGSTALGAVQFSFAENSVDGESYLSPEGPPTWKEESDPPLCSVAYQEICYPPNDAEEENQASKQSWRPVELTSYFNDESSPDEEEKSSDMSDVDSEQEEETAKPKVTFVYMNQGASSPPIQYDRLQRATQDEHEDRASRSRQNDETTMIVESNLDEVDGAFFMIKASATSEMLDMEPSPRCVPSLPIQYDRLQRATQDQHKDRASRSRQNDETTMIVESNLDEVDGAFFMTKASATSETLDMEPSPRHVPSAEKSWGRAYPMEIDPIASVNTPAAVPSPSDFSLVRCAPEDFLPGGASPVGISMGGIRGVYDTVTQSEDFTVTVRPGMQVIIRHGDITDEFTDVIVTSADRHLNHREGVGRAVCEAAGEELVSACRRWTAKHGPVDCGKNVWTVGGNLKCSHVLHVVLRPPQGGRAEGTELKEVFMDLLKTCAHSLQASHVSMPAIGVARMSVSKKVWARAFFGAVQEIAHLYDKGWLKLSTLVLVDRNMAVIREVRRVFKSSSLSGPVEESFDQGGCQESPFSALSYSSTGAFNAPPSPRFRARGPSGVHNNGASRRGFSNTEPLQRSSSYRSPKKKYNSGAKSSFMNDSPVDPDQKCAICLRRIIQEKKLPCKHRFCRECVDIALSVKKSCPTCRQPVG